MTKKKRKQPQDPDLDSFVFTPTGLDLKWTKDFITVFDGYRIHRCFDLTFIERAIGEGALPQTFIDQWRVIRTVLHRFAAVSPKVPGVLKVYEQRQMLRYIATFLMVIAVPMIVATYVFSLVWLAPISLPLTAIAFLFFVAQWTVGHYLNLKTARLIDAYWDSHPGLLRKENRKLREWTQRLIEHARFRLRKENQDPEKHPVKFYNKDYDGIIVKAEPNWYRKHYVIQIAI